MKKARKNTWDGLNTKVLEVVVRKLSFVDAVHFSGVCISWRVAAKTSRVFSQPLLLSIPRNQPGVKKSCDGSPQITLQLRSLANGLVSHEVANIGIPLSLKNFDYRRVGNPRRPKKFVFQCIGISKDTLVLQDKLKTTQIIAISPFSRQQFDFPDLENFLYESNIDRIKHGYNLIQVLHPKPVVLFLSEEQNLVVVVMYRCFKRTIAYCQSGGDNEEWKMLESDQKYVDMVARQRRLYVLSDSGKVDIWEFDQSSTVRPTKVASFIPSERLPSAELESLYLFESKGEFFLVRRIIAAPTVEVGPFKTVKFVVYKSCLRAGEKWEAVESLGDDTSLFLGGIESAVVSVEDLPEGFKGNSIYFAGDRQITSMTSRGPDMGVYSLEHGSVMAYYKLDDDDYAGYELDPAPFWMVKNTF